MLLLEDSISMSKKCSVKYCMLWYGKYGKVLWYGKCRPQAPVAGMRHWPHYHWLVTQLPLLLR